MRTSTSAAAWIGLSLTAACSGSESADPAARSDEPGANGGSELLEIGQVEACRLLSLSEARALVSERLEEGVSQRDESDGSIRATCDWGEAADPRDFLFVEWVHQTLFDVYTDEWIDDLHEMLLAVPGWTNERVDELESVRGIWAGSDFPVLSLYPDRRNRLQVTVGIQNDTHQRQRAVDVAEAILPRL